MVKYFTVLFFLTFLSVGLTPNKVLVGWGTCKYPNVAKNT